jgi:hypothetical protein
MGEQLCGRSEMSLLIDQSSGGLFIKTDFTKPLNPQALAGSAQQCVSYG